MNLDALDPLTLQQFRSFCTAIEKGGYAEAARVLSMSVPAVWGHVHQLEQQYRTPLFVRVGRGVQPTEAGRRLYESARPLLDAFLATFEIVRAEPTRPQTLTVLTGVRMTLEDLGPALRSFREVHPIVKLRLLHGDNRKAEPLLLGGDADLALAMDPGPGMRQGDIHFERAYRLEYLAVLPEGHALAARPRLRLADLVAQPLVLGSRETYGRLLLEQALHREDLTEPLRIAAETDNSAYTVACVRAGLGIGLLAGRMDGALTQGLTVRSLEPDLGQAWIVLLWKKGKRLSVVERAFVDIVKETLADIPRRRERHAGRE